MCILRANMNILHLCSVYICMLCVCVCCVYDSMITVCACLHGTCKCMCVCVYVCILCLSVCLIKKEIRVESCKAHIAIDAIVCHGPN